MSLITRTTKTLAPAPQKNVNSPSLAGNPTRLDLHAPYLLLTCMDFRLRREVHHFMELRVGKNSYDEIVLPGASLAVINDVYPHWRQTFEDVLKLAVELHGVTTVILMDHRECGAYNLFKGKSNLNSCEKETSVHRQVMGNVKAYLLKNHPSLKIETLLMDLKGQVETIITDD
jgi:carbonic anhydrase